MLPFLIQSPIVRLLLANWRIISEYLKCKVSLYLGILASCSPVYEVYVVCAEHFLNNVFNTAHVEYSLSKNIALLSSLAFFFFKLKWRIKEELTLVK